MKINAISFGAFTEPLQPKSIVAEETGNSPIPNDYDDTRLAHVNTQEPKVSSPIEKTNGTVEDLMQAQASTNQMAKSYGFENTEQAAQATSVPTDSVSAISSSNSMSLKA